MSKKSGLLVVIVLMFASIVSHGETIQGDVKPGETAKAKSILLSPEESAKMKSDQKDNFSKAYANSSPEVKEALLKASKELQEKRSQENQSSE